MERRNKVIEFLSKEYQRDIETETDFQEAILLLDNDQTRRAWREVWDASQSSFTKLYPINRGNFSKWISATKNSYVSARAVKKFLSGDKYDLDFPIITKEDLYSTIRERIRDEDIPLRGILFIDGDNLIGKMYEIREMMDNVLEPWGIHVVFSIARLSTHLLGLETCPWLSIVYPAKTGREAVDHNVSFLAGAINMLLWERRDIFFGVVSDDHFAELLCSEIKTSGRKAIRITKADTINV